MEETEEISKGKMWRKVDELLTNQGCQAERVLPESEMMLSYFSVQSK